MTSSTEDTAGTDTRSQIVAAAARLLREGGAAAVTTRAVAQAAGVPAPTIFRVFGDKDGLFDSMAEYVMAAYLARKSAQARTEDGDPVEDLRAAWRAHIGFGLDNPELFALLVAPGRAQRASVTAAGIDVLRARVERLAAAGRLAVPVAAAVDMIAAAGTGSVLTLIDSRAGEGSGERDGGLADAMFEAVLGAIVADRPAPPAADLAALTTTAVAAAPALPGLSPAERALLVEWLERSAAAIGAG